MARLIDAEALHKHCYGLCVRCVWRYNGGCSEWNGWMELPEPPKEEENEYE